MKKTCRIKLFIIAVIMLFTSVIPLCFTACNEVSNGNIYINMDYKLYEYDEKTNTSSTSPINGTNIKVGQYYRVVFNVTFDDLKATLQDDTVNLRMTVNMGDYDNELNKRKLLDSTSVSSGGLSFSEKENETGVFISTFSIEKDRVPDFSTCDFIIVLRSFGANGSVLNVENMSVEFTITDPKTNRKVYIHNANDKDGVTWYTVSLLPVAGEMYFSYDENLITTSSGINSIIVKVPLNCVKIHVEIYFDENKSGIYGNETFEETTFDGTGTNKYLTLNFNELMIKFTGEERYNLLLNQTSPSIYVVLTADGGRNYGTQSFGYVQRLRG